MINLLHINSNYADAFYVELYSSISKEGFNNIVFIPQKNNFDDCPNAQDVIKSQCYSKMDRFFLKRKANKIFNALEEKVDLNKVDLIHAHSLYTSGVPAYYCFLKYKIPYVVSVRYNDVTVFTKINPFSNGLISKVLSNAKAIVFISPLTQKIAFEKYKILHKKEINDKCAVIPNKISDCFLENNSSKTIERNKSLNLLFVGRPVKLKRLKLLVKHCSKLFKEGDKLTIIAGSDQEPLKYLKKYNFIEYHGVIKHDELPLYYKQADIFVLLSRNEVFGISYIEAISQGTPIVWAKNQAIDGLFEQGLVGYGVEAKKYKDFKNKINLILCNYDEISKNCVHHSKEFSSDIIINKLVSVYRKQ